MPRKQQRRIVLDAKHEPFAEQILEQTGIANCSQLFTILLINYGDRLVENLKGSRGKNNVCS
ncbi:hypothetical protein AB0756_39875 [Tolypothrix campylonemoides VB511288_2]|uniref:Uncharacterized protein n=3 Tax=Nostocales TaxID=1161 RepID=A0A0C1RAE4_9CYAN